MRMDPSQSSRVWTFAGCVLDERKLELKVGGAVADLDRKPLEVLLHLLRHAGEVVTKDELAEAVWPGRIITDSNLTKTVAVMRAALGESGADAVKTVHGYGYRLVAPVSVQVPAVELGPARFNFQPGESPPLRPLWILSERLGTGGQGEVWLAHHSGTKEPRVFKFAEGGRALTALKREITLNRLLRETLPERDDFLRLLDWNVEEAPFFIESEYVAGGNLAAWLEARGGAGAVSLDQRLGLLAAAAEAVAAAHSVGVLHKDLKPANVLVAGTAESPTVKLADFGSGGVVDPSALEAYGITRMGFTQTVHTGKDTSGTPIYFAPEVLAGQPVTVKSDIYALGVMLYQLAARDLRKALAPGWEKDIPDELLREDIGAAAAGDPADRLGDAAEFARRLRLLDARRALRRKQVAERAETERALHTRQELKRLRAVAVVLLVVTVVAMAAGLSAYVSRNEARAALETSRAVSDFVTKDLFASIDPDARSVSAYPLTEFVDLAAKKVDERLRDQPLAAAEMHGALGFAYRGLALHAQRVEEWKKAVALYETVQGPDSEQALTAKFQLGVATKWAGDPAASQAIQEQVLSARQRLLGPEHPDTLLALQEVAVLHGYLGHWRRALKMLQEVLAAQQRAHLGASRMQLTEAAIGVQLWSLGDYAGSEQLLRKLVVVPPDPQLGVDVRLRARFTLAAVLIEMGRWQEAEQVLDAIEPAATARTSTDEVSSGFATMRTQIAVEAGRPEEAFGVLRKNVARAMAAGDPGAALGHVDVARLQARMGRHEDAVLSWRKAAPFFADYLTPENPGRATHYIDFAVALALTRRFDEAESELARISAAALDELPARHPYRAELRRAQGWIAIGRGRRDEGRASLGETREIYEALFGPDDWRTRRAKAELARAS